MKKIYQLSLAAALLLSPTFAATSFAQTLLGESWASAESFEMPSGVNGASAYVNYKLKGSQAIVTGMGFSYTDVKIPASFSKSGVTYTVVGIADNAFNTTDGKKITSITLPSTITKIGHSAFYGSKLTSITLPSSLQEIGAMAFYNNDGLKSLTIPSSVITINDEAFNDCDYIASVTFSGTSKCKTIGDKAFKYLGYGSSTPLTSITIPNSVTSLGKEVFYACKVKNLTLGTGITTISSLAGNSDTFKNNLESITMNGVQTIPANAFQGYTKLNTASFSAATSIGGSAFEGTGLTSITIPSTVKTVNARAFAECKSVTSVLISSSYAKYGEDAFVNLPTSAIVKCSTSHNYITNDFNGGFTANPASITGKLHYSDGTPVISITGQSATFTQVGWAALYCVNTITSVILPKTVTRIGGFAFSYCTNLATIQLTTGSSIKTEKDAFSHSGITEIKNSGCITQLGIEACQDSKKLTSFDFSGLKEIPNYAFSGCESLSSLSNIGNITTIGDYAFNATAENVSFNSFSSLTSIGDGAFANNKNLTGVTFNSKLTKIGTFAFKGCTAIPNVSFANVLQPVTVGDEAFSGCTKIATLIIPELSIYCKFDYVGGTSNPLWDAYTSGVATVIKSKSSSTITDLVIPSTVTKVNNFCFAHNTSIKTLNIEENVKEIGWSAFSGTKALTTITLPSTLTNISSYGLSNLPNLTSITCNATKVPTAVSNSFQNITYANVTLNVPADTKSKYAAATGWKNFSSNTIQNCAAPEISTLNGKVVFKTTTLGAKVIYSVEYGGISSSSVTTDSSTGTATSSWITPSLKITAYASKDDHANSPKVTKTITLNTPGLKGDVNLDGVVNIADVTAVVNAALGK